MRPENPFHIYPIYVIDTPLSKLGYYSAPTYRSPSFQFKRLGTATVSAFDLVTDTGTVISQLTSEISTFEDSEGYTHYWANGNNFDTPPVNGTMYRPRITLSSGSVYWGHMVCADAVFNIAYPSVRVAACADGVITLGTTYTLGANIQITVSDNNSAYTTTLDLDDPSIDTDNLTADSGSYSANVEIVSYLYGNNGGTRRVSATYVLSADESDICGVGLTLVLSEQTGLEDIDAYELTVFNTKDIQSQSLLYSQGFRQKFWFKGYFAQPQPRLNENYLENGESERFFQSARVSEAQVLEFWPCPDRASIGLSFAKYNDRIILVGAGNSYTLYQFEFEAVEVEREDRPKGRITAEFDGAFIQANLSNYEPA